MNRIKTCFKSAPLLLFWSFIYIGTSTCQAQSTDDNASPSSRTTKSELENSMRSLKVLAYIELFTKEISKHNIRLNKSGGNDYITIEFIFSDLGVKYGDLFKNTIAIALGSNIDSIVKLEINERLWDDLSDVDKASTIFHEVCHDLLNVKHIHGDRLNLMHPSAQPRNMAELQIMTDKFFRDYKLGRVKFFHEGFYVHDYTKTNQPFITKLK
jgi:hypothetical protein|tara:strand:+ start:63 stop:698 length:636 start_codon:yes stop_codon:yes gene_type:complete